MLMTLSMLMTFQAPQQESEDNKNEDTDRYNSLTSDVTIECSELTDSNDDDDGECSCLCNDDDIEDIDHDNDNITHNEEEEISAL